MSVGRKITFNNDGIYHVFNRGIERRPVFTSEKEYQRAVDLLQYYRYLKPPVRFSYSKNKLYSERINDQKLLALSEKAVDIIAYCLMPNHFHFLLRQKSSDGISKFLSNFTNAYVKYFNIKHGRTGPLFEGPFKAVYIESDEQLIHVSRYIHLNPVASSVIAEQSVDQYNWSSYMVYINQDVSYIDTKTVLSFFKNRDEYKKFILDQVDQSKKLDVLKHLNID